MTDHVSLPMLAGERVLVRPPRPGELHDLADVMAADPEASPWWSHDADVIRRWLLEDPDYRVLVVEELATHLVAGIVAFQEELDPDYDAASMDIALLSCCTGRGLGPEALRLLGEWLVDERGHHRLTIDPAVANARAIHVYKELGYRPVGVARNYERGPDGTWHNNLLMDMLAGELVRLPEPAGLR